MLFTSNKSPQPAFRKPLPETATGAKPAKKSRKALVLLAVTALSLTGCSVASSALGTAGGSNPELASTNSITAKEGQSPMPHPTRLPQRSPSGHSSPRPTTGTPTAGGRTSASPQTPTPAPSQSPSPTASQASTAQASTAQTAATQSAATLPATGQAAQATTGDGIQAAAQYGWGAVVAGDEFNYTGAPDATKWSVYNGPGHAGHGTRTPNAWSVANGVATVSGDASGNTGGMSAKFAKQRYGRWEARMRTSARDPQYHPLLILWPDASSSTCAEVDYAESTENTAQMKFFLHYACGGSNFQSYAITPVDTTVWHNYAVEWIPSGITGYIDGVKTFTDTNPAHLPTGTMHQTIQLDWFPNGGATKPTQMQVDWVRVYK